SIPMGVDNDGKIIGKQALLAQAADYGRTMKEAARETTKAEALRTNSSSISHRTILEAIGAEKASLVLTHFATAADAVRHAENVSRN
ncbi:hypothetical protein, partial [Stenotrophomonas maltophilia]|uniref:hypothetical protein n=1 Tax=Stenotrophomonas maltophilia TaxID=40324 RepID=UPI0013DD814D